MALDRKFKILFTAAYDYLESKIGKETLEKKLNHYRHYNVDNMHDVFWHLVNSLTNKVGMRATIGAIDPLEPFSCLALILCKLMPITCTEIYRRPPSYP